MKTTMPSDAYDTILLVQLRILGETTHRDEGSDIKLHGRPRGADVRLKTRMGVDGGQTEDLSELVGDGQRFVLHSMAGTVASSASVHGFGE